MAGLWHSDGRSVHTLATRSVCSERSFCADVFFSEDLLISNTIMASMSNEETFRFIHLYQAENCLWNPKNKDHKNKNIVNDAWKRIADTMGVPVHELKKKKESLMTYFRSNLKKKISSLKSGAGEDDAYKPIWIFYDAMEVFLKDVYECNSICDTEQNDNESQETGIRGLGIRERLDDVEDNDGVETSHSGNIPSSQNNNLPKSQGVQKRRSKNPTELQEASKHVSAAFNTLNKVLQSRNNKEDNNHDDDSDLFGKLMAKQLKDFPKEERDEIMYEIHGLIMKRRRVYQERMLLHSLSPTIRRNRSSSAQSSYSNESLPKRNICSPESPSPTLYTHTCPSHTIIGHTSSSGTSYITTTLPQNLSQETEYQTSLVDQQPILYSHTSPSHIIIRRPSSSSNSNNHKDLTVDENTAMEIEDNYLPENLSYNPEIVDVLSRKRFQNFKRRRLNNIRLTDLKGNYVENHDLKLEEELLKHTHGFCSYHWRMESDL